MNFHILAALISIPFFLSCGYESSESSTKRQNETEVLHPIEKAHSKSEFLSHDVIEFNVKLEFGGSTRLDGKMTLMTNSSKGKIEKKDGGVILFSNDTVYHSPDIENSISARFAAYTWSYFFLLPYKLSDQGAHLTKQDTMMLNEQKYLSSKLTFGEGVGDAPDDWYLLYANPENQRLVYSAYIVTAKNSVEKAEEDPHAIQYSNYASVEGIPIATEWTFWGWREDDGLTDQLGSAKLTNMRMTEASPGMFKPNEDYILVAELK